MRVRAAALALLFTAAVLATGSTAVAQGAPAEPRIRWTDIVLLDGSTLPAGALIGKPVIVEFWASWCPFCKKQNPYLQRLHQKHADRDLVIMTFSIDSDAQAARDYMKSYGYTFAAAMAGAQSEQWFARKIGLPVLYVVDAEGRIVLTEVGEMFEEDVAALSRFAAPPVQQR